jgi:hypothetical protein
MKNALKGQRFADLRDIQRNMTTLLRDTPENDFEDCMLEWPSHEVHSITRRAF